MEWLCRVMCVALAAWSCLTLGVWILGQGYVPRDDALRHVARALSGRPWNDVLVVSPEMSLDQHPGWHWLLHLLSRQLHLRAGQLIGVSVWGLSALVLLAPLGRFQRPEAWLASLLLAVLAEPLLPVRLFLGRPYLISVAVLLVLCANWRLLCEPWVSRAR